MSAAKSNDAINSNTDFRRLFEEAPLPYQSLDDEGRLIEVNGAWERAFGYVREEVLGRYFGKFHAPGQEGKLRRAFHDLLDCGVIDSIEFDFRCKDGTRKLMTLNGRIARDERGRFLRTHCILNDITERKRIEKKLQDSEEKYRLAMEAAQDGLWDWDVTTGNVYYSPSWRHILGEKDAQHDYSAWEDRIHPVDKPRILKTLGSHLVGETTVWQEEHRLRRVDGSWVWVLGRGRVVERDRNGSALRMVGTMIDIENRKQAEKALRKSEERLRALINATTEDVVVLLDSDFRMEIVNERAARGFGKTVAEIVGHPLGEFMPTSIANNRREHAQQVISSGNSVRFEDQRAGRWYDNNMCPVFDDKGNPQAVAIFARDITDRKMMEQALGEAKESAEKANRAKSRFLAAANHDLRQPLHAIRLLLESLTFYELDVRANEVVEDMKDALQSMERLLNALLDISKLEAGVFVPQRQNFHFVPFLYQLRGQFKATAEAAGKNVRVFPSDAMLHTDPILLARILQNFIANAIRHTRGVHILVGCRRAGNHRRIEVWDNGLGIPVDQTDKIFEEFYQIGNPTRSLSQGLGLGLAIAKRIADLLNLRIGVRSIRDKGSVFYVEVPSGEENKQATDEQTMPATSPVRRQGVILVVEDDQIVLKATKGLLDALGYDVICASCAEDALDLVQQYGQRLRLALLDYRLPNDWNGIRLIQDIRKLIDWELPAILITGDTSINRLNEVRLSRLPLLHKPVDLEVLRRLIEETEQIVNHDR